MRMLVKAGRILLLVVVIGGLVLGASAAIGTGGPNKNIVVVSYLANGAAYNIQGDGKNVNAAGLSAYYDGIDSVDSILNANTYNRMPVGDWQLTMLNSTARSVRIDLSGKGVSGETAPDLLNHGTGLPARLIENCTKVFRNVTAMVAGQTMTCPAWFRFDTSNSNLWYGLGLNSDVAPGVSDISIYCVSNGGNGHCNYWTFDPPGGVPAVAQLQQQVNSRGGITTTVLGYFTLTFHFEVDERQSNP